MTIDDERAAFMRDLLRVLTSLYSWAGAVVHGTTEDGHDVIELCDGTRVWTEHVPTREGFAVAYVRVGQFVSPFWQSTTRSETLRELVTILTKDIADHCIRDLLTGPPEDA